MIGRSNAWRLVIDGAMNGAENMARDEALALCAGSEGPAVLRAYSFHPSTITVGRFQRVPAGIDLDACKLQDVDIVRRPTGGRAILHANDFTYSVAMPSSGSGVSERDNVFGIVAVAILAALENLGIKAQQVSRGKGARGGEDWCFESVFGVDLEWRGRKICGSAQRSMADCILQHGSLFLREPDAGVRSIVTSSQPERWGEAPFVSIGEASGRDVSWEQVLEAFQTGFESALGIVLKPDGLTPGEEELSERLAAEKYRDNEWLWHPERTSHVRLL